MTKGIVTFFLVPSAKGKSRRSPRFVLDSKVLCPLAFLKMFIRKSCLVPGIIAPSVEISAEYKTEGSIWRQGSFSLTAKKPAKIMARISDNFFFMVENYHSLAIKVNGIGMISLIC